MNVEFTSRRGARASTVVLMTVLSALVTVSLPFGIDVQRDDGRYRNAPSDEVDLIDLIFEMVRALLRCAKYLRSHPEYITVDHALGATIAIGQLKETILLLRENCTSDYTLCSPLRAPELFGWFQEIIINFRTVRNHVVAKNPNYEKHIQHLLREGLWTSVNTEPPPRLPLPLPSACRVPAGALQVMEMVEQFSGPPSEKESEACIRALVRSAGKRKHCAKVSSTCVHAGPAYGYAASHRVLFQLLATRLDCRSSDEVPISDALSKLCRGILNESHEIACHGFPPLLRDLFAEQVALCGLCGFREFVRPGWVAAILSWQSSPGCFGNFNETKRALKHIESMGKDRFDRDKLGGTCSSHLTATAAAALAVSVRVLASDVTHLILT